MGGDLTHAESFWWIESYKGTRRNDDNHNIVNYSIVQTEMISVLSLSGNKILKTAHIRKCPALNFTFDSILRDWILVSCKD